MHLISTGEVSADSCDEEGNEPAKHRSDEELKENRKQRVTECSSDEECDVGKERKEGEGVNEGLKVSPGSMDLVEGERTDYLAN